MRQPLRFLHLTTFYPPYAFGGDAIYIYRLAHALADRGHHVDVVHCRDAYHLMHPGSPEVDFPGHPKVRVHGLSTGHTRLSPLLTHQTGRLGFKRRQVAEVFENNRYDVVHYHNISLMGPEALTLQPMGGSAVKVYTTHEHWLVCPTHVLWKFNSRPCDKPQCLRCTLSAKRPPQLWRYSGFLERASRHVDQFVAPSRFTARVHAERGFAKPLAYLPHFTERSDSDWIRPGPRPQPKPYFLFVGRLEMIKGVQILIRVWPRVSGADLLVVGTGTYEPELRRMAAGNPGIKFLGARSQKDLGALYYHALACIVPSITYETSGMVILEAFARKTPVIANHLGPFPEPVEESNGGYLYRTDQELLWAINQIAASSRLRDELGENGYRAFLRNWSKEAHLKMYFELIDKLTEAKYGHIPWKDENSEAHFAG